jgi:hypothetical protein
MEIYDGTCLAGETASDEECIALSVADIIGERPVSPT